MKKTFETCSKYPKPNSSLTNLQSKDPVFNSVQLTNNSAKTDSMGPDNFYASFLFKFGICYTELFFENTGKIYLFLQIQKPLEEQPMLGEYMVYNTTPFVFGWN